MPVDDNAFLLLRTGRGSNGIPACKLQREWKSIFSFSSSTGALGSCRSDGLGGSYGTERLTWYRMLPEMGPPETTIWEYPMADDSWDYGDAPSFSKTSGWSASRDVGLRRRNRGAANRRHDLPGVRI